MGVSYGVPRGRPWLSPVRENREVAMSDKIYKKFLFNKERDGDILEWLESHNNQSREVRKALRAYMKSQGILVEPTLTDVLDEVKELSKQLANIKVVQGSNKIEDHQEPADLVAKLRNFGA